MSTLFTLTVVDQGNATKHAEVQLIERALKIAATDARAAKVKTSANIVNDKGVVIGSWTYTGSAGPNG